MKSETVAEMIRRIPTLVCHKVTDVWKAIKTAELLVPNYLCAIESKSAKWSAKASAN